MQARQRRGRHALEAGDAHDLLDQIGLTMDVRTPRRHGDRQQVAFARKLETERLEDRLDFLRFDFDAG